MTDRSIEAEARLKVLNTYHGIAAWLLTFDCVSDEADDPFGRSVRRWAQACKLQIVDGISLSELELHQACQHAIERAFHPDRVLQEQGFVLPGLAVVR